MSSEVFTRHAENPEYWDAAQGRIIPERLKNDQMATLCLNDLENGRLNEYPITVNRQVPGKVDGFETWSITIHSSQRGNCEMDISFDHWGFVVDRCQSTYPQVGFVGEAIPDAPPAVETPEIGDCD